jgi:hypothetical protein
VRLLCGIPEPCNMLNLKETQGRRNVRQYKVLRFENVSSIRKYDTVLFLPRGSCQWMNDLLAEA